jgi:methyl-accepting chemotaxis protein
MSITSPYRFNLGKMSFRIGLIGLVAIAGMALVAATYWHMQDRLAVNAAQLHAADVIDLNRDVVAIQSLQVRIHEKGFLINKNEDHLTHHDRSMHLISEALEIIYRDGSKFGLSDITQKTAQLRDMLQIYENQLQRLAAYRVGLGLNENEGIEGKLRKAVREIETTLISHDQPRLSVLMLMMRRHEKDFIMRLQPVFGEELEKRVAEFKTMLLVSAIPGSEKDNILKQLTAYQDTFRIWMRTALALEEGRGYVEKAFANVEPLLKDIDALLKSHKALTVQQSDLEVAQLASFMWLVMGLSIAATSLLVLLIGRSISRPLGQMTGAIQQLGAGDFNVELPGRGRKDELGDMATAIDLFKDKLLIKARTDAARDQEQLRMQAEARKQESVRLADAFESSVGTIISQVAGLSSQLSAAASELARTAELSQLASSQAASSSAEVSNSAGSVASATEELSSSITEIDRQMTHASKVSMAVNEQARATEHAGHELLKSSGRITEVVSLIRSIAEQTNLLALNATIEAARAGEAGRGFAVVASEVKQLATQTADATNTIATFVQSMTSAAQRTVTGMDAVISQLASIADVSTAISVAVSQQTATTSEISRDVQFVAGASANASAHISEVGHQVNTTGAAAEELAVTAGELMRGSEELKRQMDSFLNVVRAA